MNDAPASSTTLELSALFGLPLQSLVDADAAAAKRFLDVVRDLAFEGRNEERWGEMRYVSFTFRHVVDGIVKRMTVAIPLLSLIPLPILQMTRARLRFHLRVVRVTGGPPAADAFDLERNPRPVRCPRIMAVYDRAASAGPTIAVELHVAAADLPGGIGRMLNLTHDATHSPSQKGETDAQDE
ncbi:MAG TPA: DUF2589 domain-containing protein [Thermoanaerobaculia bacterium]